MTMATITYLGDLRTECKHNASGTIIHTDAPVDNQGLGRAFSPTDLCAVALASCALTIMGIYAKNEGIEIEGARVEVDKVMGVIPRRISKISIVFHMPRSYSPQEQQALEEAVASCPVCFSLHGDVEKDMRFVWPA